MVDIAIRSWKNKFLSYLVHKMKLMFDYERSPVLSLTPTFFGVNRMQGFTKEDYTLKQVA